MAEREILFRGKRTDNGEWVYGWLGSLHCCNAQTKEIKSVYFTEITQSFDCRLNVIVDYKTVGQYTGLTDKNGVKIFEGDIVRYGTNTNRAENKEIHEVVFETRGGSRYFGIRISEIETWQFCLEVPAKLMEVIGNIYDNPEFLETAAKPAAKNIAQSGLAPATENFELMEG